MKIENGKVVFGRKACTNCNEGQVASRLQCEECKGTGNGKRGGRGSCKRCYGAGKRYSWDAPQTCQQCQGKYQEHSEENECDSLPAGAFASLTFKVYRSARPLTWGEEHIGIGCVFSCTDYGRANDKDDDSLIADVKARGSVQACKVSRAGVLCDHVAIIVHQNGYTVKAVYA
jgi:hypothetical protein